MHDLTKVGKETDLEEGLGYQHALLLFPSIVGSFEDDKDNI